MSLVGVDLLDIRRIQKVLKRSRKSFLERICTESELLWLKDVKPLATKTAAIFALKEAFSKALGTGIGSEFSFKDLEVSYTLKGAPRIAYCGKSLAKRASKWKMSCSISHEGDLLVAMVMIDGDAP